jgi:hypothetical protein
MKKTFLLGLIIALIIGSCAQKESKFPQGAWQYVQMQRVFKDSVVNMFPEKLKGGDIKMWTEHNFLFVGRFVKNDTIFKPHYGGGTYTIDGNKYVETILYHVNSDAIGWVIKMKLELRNDTLYLINPVDDNGNPAPKRDGAYVIEKYVKIK